MNGVELIHAARSTQIGKGYTQDHDNEHAKGELLDAARAYVVTGSQSEPRTRPFYDRVAYQHWPFNIDSFSPDPHDPVKDLAKAGALIAAEIDRLLALREKL